jgi:hypothetical protein
MPTLPYAATKDVSAKKHFIPTERDLWKVEQYDTFSQYRIKQIYIAAKELFLQIVR